MEVGIFNSIYDNGFLGIDLGNDGPTPNHIGDATGPNKLQNTAVLRRATRNNGFLQVDLDVDTTPLTSMIIAIFGSNPSSASPFVQGQRQLAFASVTSDAEGHGSAHFTVSNVTESLVTATVSAIDSPGFFARTSEFSDPLTINDSDIVFTVTNTNDSGPGSLREAIVAANGGNCAQMNPCRIDFAIVDEPARDGTFVIQPLTPLPLITRSGIIIDGHSQTEHTGDTNPNGPEVVLKGSLCAAPCNGLEVHGQTKARIDFVHIRDLVINGFHGDGIVVTGTNTGNRIDGCYIGTDASGSAAASNDGSGLAVRDGQLEIGAVFDNRIDRVTTKRPPKGNLISGNSGNGLELTQKTYAAMYDNRIGTDRTGNEPLGNGGSGIAVRDSTISDYLGGPINRIAYNGMSGVSVTGNSSAGMITAEIFDNAGLGIDLVDDGVKETDLGDKAAGQNAPVIAPVIASVVVDRAAKKTMVELVVPVVWGVHPNFPPPGVVLDWLSLYASPYADPSGHGEGKTSLRYTVVRSATGDRLEVPEDLSGQFITATATRFDTFPYISIGNTSEFSNAVLASPPECAGNLPPLPLAPSADIISSDSPIVFEWTDVGAVEYTLWLRPSTAKAEAKASGRDRTTSITLPKGDYEWFVEARFEGCSSVRSVPVRLSVQ